MSRTISVSELEHLKTTRPPLCIDVRSGAEYAAGHVPGAVNVPLEQIEARLEDLNHCETVVLICKSGTRARMAAERLRPRREDVLVLEGGTDAWVKAKLSTVANVQTRWALERQVRLGAGLLVLVGATLALTVDPRWLYLSAFVGAGLTFAGLTDFCPMAVVLSRMPWNRARTAPGTRQCAV